MNAINPNLRPTCLPSRRDFHQIAGGCVSGLCLGELSLASIAGKRQLELKYLLGSCMYGYQSLAEILPEVAKTGAAAIDIWPRVHGNQREQLDELGEEQFAALLKSNQVSLGCITQYKLGPFGLKNEMSLAQRLGCQTLVSGGRGPAGLQGSELKAAVAEFVENMKPHVEHAEARGITIAIENHANSLIESPDSMKWLAELRPSKHLAIAFAPYHLTQNADNLANLITDLGDAIEVFYAWQHGMGCHKKLPKNQELLQLPGRGELDFEPLLAALQKIRYAGWTEIFMHPVPRGIPILETTSQVTDEINRSRKYLEDLLASK
ncbi:MAG: sugar phosphate isomerase/epimerase [Planctomycetaceae bacterium]|nr:sugar phosphate isomerase/epimerase [Planctomycetaceae bacterium]